jgi:hypothetical protein
MVITLDIPEGGHLLLKMGQKVDVDTPMMEIKTEEKTELHIAKELNIPPDKIFQHLKKFVGDHIEKNDLLAIKKGLFSKQDFFSPIEGIINEIDHVDGKLVVAIEKSKKDTIPTLIKGEVIKVEKKQVEIKVKKVEEFLLKTIDHDFGGQCYYLRSTHGTELKPEEIVHKIIFTKSISDYFQRKIETLGALGFITLNKLSEPTDLPTAQIKNITDFEKIINHKYPYCFLSQKLSKIFVYEN